MPDFHIADHGSIITIAPVSEAARDWIDENVASEPWQWLGGALCVDHRYAGNLIEGRRRLRHRPLIGSLAPQHRACSGSWRRSAFAATPGGPSWVSINYPNV
jgi:hypothetical protein